MIVDSSYGCILAGSNPRWTNWVYSRSDSYSAAWTMFGDVFETSAGDWYYVYSWVADVVGPCGQELSSSKYETVLP